MIVLKKLVGDSCLTDSCSMLNERKIEKTTIESKNENVGTESFRTVKLASKSCQ